MRPTYVVLTFALLLALLANIILQTRGTAQSRDARLPGARPTVDAASFPSLQAAIDAVSPTGGQVRLPAGQFEIREPLVIRTEDVCLEGAGTATIIKNLNENGRPAILVSQSEATVAPGQKQKKLWRIRLANFRVVGNAKSGSGIEARHINEIFIDGITSSYHGGDGIHLDNCYEDPRICDSLITYNKGVGLNLQACHDIVVSANQFEENQDALHCFDSFNLCLTGNCMDDHLGRGVVIENTYGSVASGNMIEECNGMAFVLDRDCYGITLSANVIAHNGGGIDLRDAHGCTVSANTLTLMKTDALRIGSGSDRIVVSGNSFCNSFIGEGQIKRGTNDLAAAGIVLDGTTDVDISGNVFSGLTTKALRLTDQPSRRVLFTANLLRDVDSDHAQLKALENAN